MTPSSRIDVIVDALPTLLVVAAWGLAAAALHCGLRGIGEWDLVLTMASAPIAMVVVGVGWGQQKGSLESGLDAAIVTGTVVGLLFLLSLFA